MRVLPLLLCYLLSLVLFFVASIIEAADQGDLEFPDSGIKEDITFESDRDLRDHVKKLNEEKARKRSKSKDSDQQSDFVVLADEDLPDEKEMKDLKRQEVKLQIELKEIEEKFGRMTSQYAQGLHKLGRILYKQFRFDHVFQVAKDIVEIHEKIDGVESFSTAQALSNLGSAAYRTKNKKECDWAMNRALFILIKLYGDESKEVLLHRGRMLTFHIPYAETSMGLSYEDYEYEL